MVRRTLHAARRGARPTKLLVASGTLVLGLTAAFGPGGPLVRAQEEEGSYVTVRALDDFYEPPVIRIPVGGEVYWTMSGRNPHTVTADDGSSDSGVLTPGQEYERTYDEPGVYPYYCTLHGTPGKGMAATVVVGDVPLPRGGGTRGRDPVPAAPGQTIEVPADQPTIQAAVDAAAPGDLVLVSPGTYKESVIVLTPYLTIRGTDRNTVVLDGGSTLANGIHVIEADGVAIENLTAHHYQLNGFYWTGVYGYRGSYLTAYANGDYGIYAFDSVYGRLEHSYASGSPDSAFYIGQCQPCYAVIDDILAEGSALGYSGTNAGGELAIVNSEWRDNMAGIVPNTLDSEKLAPQAGVLIAGNWVHDNANLDAPVKRLEWPSFGNGILVAGGRDNEVRGNRVENNPTYGIVALPNLDANLWPTAGNRVIDNEVARSGRADLALGAPSLGDDCFSGNVASTSMPAAIQAVNRCGPGPWLVPSFGDPAVTFSLLAAFAEALGGHYPQNAWQDAPAPPPQPNLPDAATAPVAMAVPEVAVPGPYEIRPLSAIPSSVPADGPLPEVTILGIPLSQSPFGLLIGTYGYLLPLILAVTWIAIAFWDLIRREDLSQTRTVIWMFVILIVPFAGPIIYYVFGGSQIERGVRVMLVLGGLVVYLLVAALAFVIQSM